MLDPLPSPLQQHKHTGQHHKRQLYTAAAALLTTLPPTSFFPVSPIAPTCTCIQLCQQHNHSNNGTTGNSVSDSHTPL